MIRLQKYEGFAWLQNNVNVNKILKGNPIIQLICTYTNGISLSRSNPSLSWLDILSTNNISVLFRWY